MKTLYKYEKKCLNYLIFINAVSIINHENADHEYFLNEIYTIVL